MRKTDFILIDTPLSKRLIRLCQKYYVQIQPRSACQNVENRDAVGSNDLGEDRKPLCHTLHSSEVLNERRACFMRFARLASLDACYG